MCLENFPCKQKKFDRHIPVYPDARTVTIQHITPRDVGNSTLRFWTATLPQVCDEIFIDINKSSRVCILLKASHKINAFFSCKHAFRTYRFNHSSCISKNKPFSETKRSRCI